MFKVDVMKHDIQSVGQTEMEYYKKLHHYYLFDPQVREAIDQAYNYDILADEKFVWLEEKMKEANAESLQFAAKILEKLLENFKRDPILSHFVHLLNKQAQEDIEASQKATDIKLL